MSETIEPTNTEAVVVPEAEAVKESDKTPDTNYQELIDTLKKDNYEYRTKLKNLKSAVEELTTAKTALEQEKQEWEKHIADTRLKEREQLIKSELDRISIVDESARKLAVKMLGDSEDIAEGFSKVIKEYPFLVGKSKVVIPDTGNAHAQAVAVSNENKLSAGLSKLIKH